MGPLAPMIVRLDHEERIRSAEADRLAARIGKGRRQQTARHLTTLIAAILTTLRAN